MSKFPIDARACLEAAIEMNFRSVVIIGVSRNGRMIVYSNDGRTYDLLDKAPKHLEALSES
jgi:hypothetical protein